MIHYTSLHHKNIIYTNAISFPEPAILGKDYRRLGERD